MDDDFLVVRTMMRRESTSYQRSEMDEAMKVKDDQIRRPFDGRDEETLLSLSAAVLTIMTMLRMLRSKSVYIIYFFWENA